jgi:hypothetical protein
MRLETLANYTTDSTVDDEVRGERGTPSGGHVGDVALQPGQALGWGWFSVSALNRAVKGDEPVPSAYVGADWGVRQAVGGGPQLQAWVTGGSLRSGYSNVEPPC